MPILQIFLAKMMSGGDVPEDKITEHKKNLEILDQLIGSNKYLAGYDLTLAALFVLATLSYADIAKYDMSSYKNFERWRSDLKKDVKISCLYETFHTHIVNQEKF